MNEVNGCLTCCDLCVENIYIYGNYEIWGRIIV
jgi:uncharacterized protein YuzB (UPF0349 family)